jgi:arylsulfatase A-like enzyme
MTTKLYLLLLALFATLFACSDNNLSNEIEEVQTNSKNRPNFVLIYTDDQRFDYIGYENSLVNTPNMDRIASNGVKFSSAIVTTALCSPSRATLLTGRYASVNGVLSVDLAEMDSDEVCFSQTMKNAGYRTGFFGKWHLQTPPNPESCGFDEALYFHGIEAYFDTPLYKNGKKIETSGYLEDTLATSITEYIDSVADGDSPFLVHYSSLAPHMDKYFEWPNTPAVESSYGDVQFPLPESWLSDMSGKPSYLLNSRSRRRAINIYGYDEPLKVEAHQRAYAGSVSDLDRAVGTIIDALIENDLMDNTYIVFMGDNGWLMGEFKMTSKLLAYEASIRVPMFISGPTIPTGITSDALVTNADIAPTILKIAGIEPEMPMNGKSLKSIFNDPHLIFRDMAFYEAPASMHEVYPIRALRNNHLKFIQTLSNDDERKIIFEELYDLSADPNETKNIANTVEQEHVMMHLRKRILIEEENIKSIEQ